MKHHLAHRSDLTRRIIGVAMHVHRLLSPGLLESVNEKCLRYEPADEAVAFRRQVPLPAHYGDTLLHGGYIADVIVDNQAVLELRSVEQILPLHDAQLLTYLRLTECRVGILINFNTVSLTDGITGRVLKHCSWSCVIRGAAGIACLLARARPQTVSRWAAWAITQSVDRAASQRCAWFREIR